MMKWCFLFSLAFLVCSCEPAQKRSSIIAGDKPQEELISEGWSQLSYVFPSSIPEAELKEYVEVVRKRLAFLSEAEVIVKKEEGKTIFSYKRNATTDNDHILLEYDLLTDFKIQFYSVKGSAIAQKEDHFILVSGISIADISESEPIRLEMIAEESFLELNTQDIAEIKPLVVKEDGRDSLSLAVVLKQKNTILSEKTKLLSQKRELVYYQISDYITGAAFVFAELSDAFTLSLKSEYPFKILEMQYKYPLPTLK